MNLLSNAHFRPGLLCFFSILFAATKPAKAEDAVTGVRVLREKEFNWYGPRPFPEEVTFLVDDMVAQILKRQEPDGSWIDQTYNLDGSVRKNHLAGGTVKIITNTSLMCLALRLHEHAAAPEVIDAAIARGVRYVVQCVNQGRLTEDIQDSGWRMGYALRLLAREYPYVEDERLKTGMRGAAEVLVKGLRGIQQFPHAAKSTAVTMSKPGELGIRLDHTKQYECVVLDCPADSTAYRAGVRAGDVLVSANGIQLGSPLNYDFMRFDWMAYEPVTFTIRRGDKERELAVTPQAVYPGTLGLQLADSPQGVVVRAADFLSDAPRAGIMKGDLLTRVADTPIRKVADLKNLALLAGQKIAVTGVRDGTPFEAQWTCAPVPFTTAQLQLAKVDKSSKPGSLINGFYRGSCMAAAGLKKEDRLLTMNGVSVLGPDQFNELRSTIPGGKRVEVVYVDATGEQKSVTATTGVQDNKSAYRSYHGIRFHKRSRQPQIHAVDPGSPADLAGAPKAAKIVSINEQRIETRVQAEQLLNGLCAGRTVALTLEADGQQKNVSFKTRLRSDSVWIADNEKMSGGWSYLTFSRTTTFMTADILMTLMDAHRNMGLQTPRSMMQAAYMGMLNARRTFPNSTVPSYLYDGSGYNNYSWVKDARQHFARGSAIDLACLRYSESGLEAGEVNRMHKDLEGQLKEWLNHRWNLDRVRFPSGHNKQVFSIAPYYLPYSYYTTMEAANYLKGNPALVEEVQRFGLAMLTSEYVVQKKPGVWFIAGLESEIPLQYYNMLMVAGELKSYFEPRITSTEPTVKPVLDAFHARRYGEALQLIQSMDKSGAAGTELKQIETAISERYRNRMEDVKMIHQEYPHDALRYLEETIPHFQGSLAAGALEKRAEEWRQSLPDLPKWLELGAYLETPAGASASDAWDRVLTMKETEPAPTEWQGSNNLLESADPKRDAVAGEWRQAGGQLISPKRPYARLQLQAIPEGSYRFETQFTRIQGHSLALILPVDDTSVVLVLGGWAGKVSGLAFIDGKDADRNDTTRDGAFTSNEKRTLLAEVRLLNENRAQIDVRLDGKPYLSWEGKRSAIRMDRNWKLNRPLAVGIGAYNATFVFHHCQWAALEDN